VAFTTTAIAALVVLAALTLMWRTFSAPPDFAQKKDVMLYGLTILGTVIGYYFGRVPAERRAEASERKSNEAQAQREALQAAQAKDEAARKLEQAKAGVERAKALLAPASTTQPKTLAAEPAPGAPVARRFLRADGAVNASVPAVDVVPSCARPSYSQTAGCSN
jgi:hypothetical protein